MSARILVTGALMALATAHATATTTTAVVDVPSRGGTQRFLYTKPEAPKANIVSIPGNDGFINLHDDGTTTTITGLCGPVNRNRLAYAERGFAVAYVDRHSSGSVYNPDDIGEVIRYMRDRHDVPTWIVGGSASTNAARFAARSLPPELPVGIIFFSPGPVSRSGASGVSRPSLVIYHEADSRVLRDAADLFDNLTSAPVRELVRISGSTTTACSGAHLFSGRDAEFVAATADFMDRVNATFPAPQVSTTAAIEYYHAGFGHYYVTAFANEISLLDGGAFGGVWTRTGQTFTVWTASSGDSNPVCRFFSAGFAPKSSHFYTPLASECEGLKASGAWSYEAIAFHLKSPDATGACPAGTTPLYRLYNEGQSGAPNHRYTTSANTVADLRGKGWVSEGIGGLGVIACAAI